MPGLDHGAVAFEVLVCGGPDVTGDEAGDDCDGEDIEVEEEIVDQGDQGCRSGHRAVARNPAAAFSM